MKTRCPYNANLLRHQPRRRCILPRGHVGDCCFELKPASADRLWRLLRKADSRPRRKLVMVFTKLNQQKVNHG